MNIGKRKMASQRLCVAFLPFVFSRDKKIGRFASSTSPLLEIRNFFTRFSLFPTKNVAGHLSVQQTKLRISPP